MLQTWVSEAKPAIYEWCEREGFHFTIGLITNPRLTALAAPLASEAQRQRVASGGDQPHHVFGQIRF